jgi:transcriptional regulator with XRE-family HTH domain
MARPNFFTPEMGARLRRIRSERGLTQDEVAARMGLNGRGRWSFVRRLEQGRIRNPYLSTVTLYLRACGAQFFEFYDTLTRIEPVVVDTRRLERAPMRKEQKQMLLHRVKREVFNYQDETSYPKQGRPIRPEKQKPAASKLADYRVQVAVIEHDVKKLLGQENVTFVEVAGYLTIARRVLGELRRGGRLGSTKQGSISDYVTRNRLNPELVERIRELVTERFRR